MRLLSLLFISTLLNAQVTKEELFKHEGHFNTTQEETNLVLEKPTLLYSLESFTINKGHTVKVTNPNNFKNPRFVVFTSGDIDIFGNFKSDVNALFMARGSINIGKDSKLEAPSLNFVADHMKIEGHLKTASASFLQATNQEGEVVYMTKDLVKIKESSKVELVDYVKNLDIKPDNISTIEFLDANIDAKLYINGFNIACFNNTNISSDKYLVGIGILDSRNNNHGLFKNMHKIRVNAIHAYDADNIKKVSSNKLTKINSITSYKESEAKISKKEEALESKSLLTKLSDALYSLLI